MSFGMHMVARDIWHGVRDWVLLAALEIESVSCQCLRGVITSSHLIPRDYPMLYKPCITTTN